jgi:two-component system, OmpR family, sensor histidine kinase PhoQ
MGAVIDNAYVESTRQTVRERMIGQIYLVLAVSELDEAGRLIMPMSNKLPIPQLVLPDSGLYAFVGNNGSDTIEWRSPSLANRHIPKPFALKVGEKHWEELTMADGESYYLLGFGFQRTLNSGTYPYNFYLLTELAPINTQITRYRQHLWGGLLGALILLLITQVLVLRWGLKPLRDVGLELSAIEKGESNHINAVYPREIKKLTDNINNLLTQERARQTSYRNALANLSHSLKTPLAVLLCGLEQPETLPETVEEQSMRMMRIVDRQLQRAGAANDTAIAALVSAFSVADRVIASLSKVYKLKNLGVANRIDRDLYIRCNEADFIEILGNLLDNAFKWSNSQIEIQGYRNGQYVTIKLSDDGPGISNTLVDGILQRGGRADESIPGHGIGLSVVGEIVNVYQGKLAIEQSELGGACVIVEFYD